MTASATSAVPKKPTTMNGNAHHHKRQEIWATAAVACFLGILGWLSIHTLTHTGDGAKHENGEQKSNRISVIFDMKMEKIESKIDLLVERRHEMNPTAKALLAEHGREIKHLLGEYEKFALALARIEALLERSK